MLKKLFMLTAPRYRLIVVDTVNGEETGELFFWRFSAAISAWAARFDPMVETRIERL